MILPRLSAAILSMSYFGTAYAAHPLRRKTSMDQWVVISGAANGAATVFDVSDNDQDLHRDTTQSHLTRYAFENGLELEGFDPLFELGQREGRKLVEMRSALIAPTSGHLVNGFHHDKVIAYTKLKQAIEA